MTISQSQANTFVCATFWSEAPKSVRAPSISALNVIHLHSTETCLTVCVVVVPLSRGWLRLYVAGSGPRRSCRWFRTLPRWPVWRRLPTVTLCRYTGSTKWLSNAPCRPRMFHLKGGWRRERAGGKKGERERKSGRRRRRGNEVGRRNRSNAEER